MLERLKTKATGAWEWTIRHRVISITVMVLAALMVYANVFADNRLTAGANTDSDKLSSSVVGFLERYGSYSYLDACDRRELDGYAASDLSAAAVEQRLVPYTKPEDPQETEGRWAAALARMAEEEMVRTATVKGIKLVDETEETWQIQAVVDEWYFTRTAGLVKQTVTYTVVMQPATVAGVGSPYLATRVSK